MFAPYICLPLLSNTLSSELDVSGLLLDDSPLFRFFFRYFFCRSPSTEGGGAPKMSTVGCRATGGSAARVVTSWMMGLSGVREPLPLIGVWPSTGLSRGFMVADPRSLTTCPLLTNVAFSSRTGPFPAPNDGTYPMEMSDTKRWKRLYVITVVSHLSFVVSQNIDNSTVYSC